MSVLSIDPPRTYLSVPFSEKDQAKALGARWDPEARKWYTTLAGTALYRFERWANLPVRPVIAAVQVDAPVAASRPAARSFQEAPPVRGRAGSRGGHGRAKLLRGGVTPLRDPSLPDCGCRHVAPWEHCEHTAATRQGWAA